MNRMTRSIIFWIISLALAGIVAIFQRTTGPTYPVKGKVTVGDEIVNYKLIRTWGEESDAKVLIPVKNKDVIGVFSYRRYKSHDTWTTTGMKRTDEGLTGIIPHQPPAGKASYEIFIYHNNEEIQLTPEPVIIRFKGVVPGWVTIFHVIFIFLAFIFSMRTGFEALVRGRYTFLYTILTVIFLVFGGLILGPVMQKYAFGALWTGWPVGHDLTDNKTAVAAIFWFAALILQIKNREHKRWAAIASIVLLLIYLIPHSLLGSEIDYTAEEQHLTESTQ